MYDVEDLKKMSSFEQRKAQIKKESDEYWKIMESTFVDLRKKVKKISNDNIRRVRKKISTGS